METFLAEVAQKLRAEHPDDLDQVTIVFNNRRSGLFLRQQFANMSPNPFFLPKIIGIDDLIADLGGLTIVPNEFLLFELFDIHRQLGGEGRKFETFEEFISFGDMMLADFSEIDLYCVDAQQLFNNLHELKALGEWDIETGRLTPFQEQYLQFYKSLYQYYDLLHQRLIAQGKAYSGMAYRYVAENISTLFQDKHARPTYFIGFNALSACENTIIQHFVKEGFGQLYTDGDAYYYNDPQQEAGYFLRKFHHTEQGYPSHFDAAHKDITITSCPESVLQCKYAGELIAKQFKEKDSNGIEQTALVLADEGLLLPALNALPEEVKTANITMGYPYTNTAVHSLVLKLFSLHQKRKTTQFHHQDILDIFTDEIIANIHGISDIHPKMNVVLSQKHIIYASAKELEEICQELNGDFSSIAFLFLEEVPSADPFLSLLRQLVQTVYSKEILDTNIKEREALASLLQILDYFEELQSGYHFFDSLSSLLKIYERLAQRHSVAFFGEPLQGLQILGVLETRNLDFKRLIILSANEGILPSGRSNNTLIPYHLKTSFGIPTFHEKDAVYAYNFYRLIQRAEEIHILYSTESDGMGKGEPSRFILQLRRELAQRYPQSITLKEEVLSASNNPSHLPFIDMREKDPACLLRLQEMASKGFSPSALNKYRGCPLLFYYEYILNIRPNDQVNEDLEQNELGTCIHAVLQKIYGLDADHHIKQETLQASLERIDEMIEEVLEEQFRHGRNRAGRNHYMESVAKSQITNFLKAEIKYLDDGHEIEILGLEEPLRRDISIMLNEETQHVAVAGNADRIDKTDSYIRVIDYKSGKVNPADLDAQNAVPLWEKVSDKWFQVMTYTWLFKATSHASLPFLAGIVPLRHFGTDFIPASWDGETFMTDEHIAAFEVMLQDILVEILDPKAPFKASPDKDKCRYCPFIEICSPVYA